MITMWHQEEFEHVYTQTDDVLSRQPLDSDFLILNGFSAFYFGLEQPDKTLQYELLNTSVVSLRRALLLTSSQYKPEIHYVLGKAYFHLGAYYHDLALDNLVAAYDADYAADDLLEYLGVAFSRMEMNYQAIELLMDSLEQRFSPVVSLYLAEILFSDEQYSSSVFYAQKTIDNTDDETLLLEAGLLIGRSLVSRDQIDAAVSHFENMLNQHSNVADIRYWLGETYYENDEPIKARAEWREAVRIDPQHAMAAARLQGS